MSVLGCDGGYSGPGGAGSGYFVRDGDTGIWLDAGPGTLGRLGQLTSLADVSGVVVSHEHPDHRADLEGLAVAIKFGDCPGPLPVFAPPSVREHFYFSDWDVFEWVVVGDGDVAEVGDLRLSFSRTDHGPETLGVRLDGPRGSLGYSADSGPGWSLEALGPGLDLALCEATWTKDDEGKPHHMSGRQAGRSAADARAGALMVTHRWPTIGAAAVAEEASEAFGAQVIQARAGLAVTVGGSQA